VTPDSAGVKLGWRAKLGKAMLGFFGPFSRSSRMSSVDHAATPGPALAPAADGQEVTFRVTSPLQRLLVEKALLMAHELEAVGAAAAWGHVFDRLEDAAVQQGRALTAAALEQATRQQVEAQEKKRRSAAARAARPGARRGPTRDNG
jgi:hypothetical protein